MIHVSQPCLGPLERALVNHALDDNHITQGDMVLRFERALAAHLRVPEVVVVSNGTAALHLALVALGIGPGDEVLVPDLTFVSTANAVMYAGAKPVLVDIDPRTWCMSVEDAYRKVTPRTKAILPVHLYGVAADMKAIQRLADLHHLVVLEDAAEGLGGTYKGQPLGTLGEAGTFSFYGNKVLTTGEGGAICTRNKGLADRLRFLRGQAHDPARRYFHPEVGYNYRLTDLQAAVGLGQMGHLWSMLAQREEIFAFYRNSLCYSGLIPVLPYPSSPDDSIQAAWLFTLQLPAGVSRDQIMAYLAGQGIETRPAFVPLHRMPMYAGADQDFPVACTAGDRGLSLPTYPGLSVNDLTRICEEVMRAIDLCVA